MQRSSGTIHCASGRSQRARCKLAKYGPRAVAEKAAGIRKDRHGSVAVLAALTLPILMSLAALVVDYGFALSQRAALQQAADSAALAGAMAYTSTASATATKATIQDVVMANGWPSSAIVGGSTGYLAQSPTNASVKAVRVTLTATSPLFFGAAILSRSTLGFTVYSLANLSAKTACIISLSSTLTFNVVVHVETCNVAANSTYGVSDNKALYAKTLYTLDSTTKISNLSNIHATLVNGTVSDPYTSVQAAATAGFSACSSYQYYISGTPMTPGCWEAPLIHTAVTLSSGVYYMKDGITLNPGGSITGTGGVTIVSSVGLAFGGNVTLTAPTSGAYSGMALYLQTGGIDFNNSVNYNINGAIYAPDPASGGLTFDTSTWNQGACTYLVAAWVTFNSGAAFTLPQTGCPGGSGGSGGSLGLAQ